MAARKTTLAKAPVKTPARSTAQARRTPTRRPATVYNRYAANARNRRASAYNYRRYLLPVAYVSTDDFTTLHPPIDGLRLNELQDSFFHRRADGRTHYAIDIFRPIGDPLYAVVDGTIEHKRLNPLGGLTVTIVDAEKRFRFYYAHLSRWADDIAEGQTVQRGDLLGYVGDTGNARGTTPHLHFQISNISGAAINPYPLLVHAVRGGVPTVPVESVSFGGLGGGPEE